MRFFLLIIASVGLVSCYGAGGDVAPVIHYGQGHGVGSAGVHMVMSGETLYNISNRYKLSMRDIAVVNHIAPPFTLYAGQRLRLPPPQDYVVQAGDTLYGVSRVFGVRSHDLARLNDMRSPYVLRVGQRLRLPSVIKKNVKMVHVLDKKGHINKAVNNAPSDKIEQEVLPAVSHEKTASISSVSRSQDGVPIPQGKPAYLKSRSIEVSKVSTKSPKRSSSKFLKPVRGKVISNYGAKKSGLHNDGINIGAVRGSSVKAAENGVVVYAGNALKGSGNLILVRHEGQWMSAYAHLDEISVRKGQTLRRGAVIGKVGSTGSVSSPQLHFEIRHGTSAKNPVTYME